MVQDLIRYDLLVQDALRSVVKKVLADAARDGMPGEHHFYVSFLTGAPGVRLSNRLREKHPEEMTIVLQHQFWDLGVTEHAFEVGLAFGGIPERLLIPFEAITGFFDPSVQFALKFETATGAETAANSDTAGAKLPKSAGKTTKTSDRAEKAVPAPGALPAPAAPVLLARPPESSPEAKPEKPAPRPQIKPAGAAADAGNQAPARGTDKLRIADKPEAEDPASPQGAQVVSLDAFRKKS